MIKKNLKTLIITGIIILLPLIWGLITYASLPEQIPIHFDIAGNVDNYGPRWSVLLISPIFLLIQWIAALDAQFKGKKEELKETYIRNVSWSMAAASIACGIVMFTCAAGNLMTAQRMMPVFVGLFLVIMGNFMPKQKKSKWAGIRIKWTLENPDNWMKTHRFFGRVSMICGFATMWLVLIPNITITYIIVSVLLLLVVVLPILYSHSLYNKEVKKDGNK